MINGGMNICFANSTLQLLYHLEEFKNMICRNENNSTEENLNNLFTALTNTTSSVNPLQTIEEISPESFQTGNQEDASEFLIHVLNSLPQNLQNIFAFNLQQSTTCEYCNNPSITNLEAQTNFTIYLPTGRPGAHIHLQILIREAFFTDFGASMICDVCHQNVQVIRTLSIRNDLPLPNVLTITLNRSTAHQSKNLFFVHIDDIISFEGHAYQLFGMVVHHGRTMNGGHYTSLMKEEHGLWWKFDDENVQIIQRNPYITYPPRMREFNTIYTFLQKTMNSNVSFRNSLLRYFSKIN